MNLYLEYLPEIQISENRGLSSRRDDGTLTIPRLMSAMKIWVHIRGEFFVRTIFSKFFRSLDQDVLLCIFGH